MKEKRRVIDNQVITYLVIIAVIIGLVAYASRSVLFRPYTARTHCSSVSKNQFVYTFGGMNRHNTPVGEVLLLDLEKETIKRIADMPSPRYAVGAVLNNDTVYIAGGQDNKTYFRDVYAFDTGKEKFTKIAEMPEPRSYGTLASSEDALYYFGGWNGSDIADTIIKIDIASGSCELIPGITEALQFHTGIQRGETFYMYGGEDSDLNYSTSLYSIDMRTLTVSTEAILPLGLIRSSAAFIGDTFYIAGGWSKGPVKKILALDTADPGTDVSILGEIPYDPEDMTLASFEADLYLIGGREERFKRQVRIVRIDPATLESESLLFKSYVWW